MAKYIIAPVALALGAHALPLTSTRRQIYDLLLAMPDGNAAARIAALGEYLDSLPPNEMAVAERRMLALNIAYRAMLEAGPKGTPDEFFATVDEIERKRFS